MHRYRKIVAALLMILGIAMLMRGIYYSLRRGLGWQNLLFSAVVGTLVFALGLTRWRYWQQR
jgi:hypothetical protein